MLIRSLCSLPLSPTHNSTHAHEHHTSGLLWVHRFQFIFESFSSLLALLPLLCALQTQHSNKKKHAPTHTHTHLQLREKAFLFIFRLLFASLTTIRGKCCGNLIIKKHSPWFRSSLTFRVVSLTHTQHSYYLSLFSRARRKIPSAKYFPRFFRRILKWN